MKGQETEIGRTVLTGNSCQDWTDSDWAEELNFCVCVLVVNEQGDGKRMRELVQKMETRRKRKRESTLGKISRHSSMRWMRNDFLSSSHHLVPKNWKKCICLLSSLFFRMHTRSLLYIWMTRCWIQHSWKRFLFYLSFSLQNFKCSAVQKTCESSNCISICFFFSLSFHRIKCYTWVLNPLRKILVPSSIHSLSKNAVLFDTFIERHLRDTEVVE